MKRYDEMSRDELLAEIDSLSREREAAQKIRRQDAEYEQRISLLNVELLSVNDLLRREIVNEKKTEHELILSNREWENTFDAITDPVMLLDTDHRIRRANRAMAEYVGLFQEELRGRLCHELVHGTDTPVASCPQSMLLHDGLPHTVDIYDERSGRYFQESVSPIFDVAGNLIGSIHYAKDVTENRKLIVALKESEARYHSLFDFSNDAMFLAHADGRIVNANPAACRMFDRTEEEMISLGRGALVDATDPRLQPALEERARTGLFAGELTFIRKDGEKFPADISSVIFHDYSGQERACIIIRDISDRKRYEAELRNLNTTLEERVQDRTAALRASEERLHLALEAARAGTWEWDMKTGENVWSDEIWRLYGLNPHFSEPTHESWLKTIHPDDLERTERAVQTAAETETELYVEYRVVTGDGSSRWLMLRGKPIWSDDGRATRYVGIGVDITERVRVENQLQETALFLNETQKIARLGGWKVNLDANYVMWTEEVYRLVEHPLNSPPSFEEGISYYAPDCIPLVRRALEDAWANNTPFSMECEMISAAGRHFPAELRCIGRIQLTGGMQCLAGTFQDISFRKKAEDAVVKSEAMYRSLFSNMLDAFAYCRMIFADGMPVDFIYLDVNEAFEKKTGLKNVVGRRVSDIIPAIRKSDPELFELYGRVATTGKSENVEIYINALDEWLAISAYSPAPEHFVVTFDTITKRKQTEEYQRKLHAMTLELSMAGERERARIADELHDQVGPNLLTCMMKLNSLRSNRKPADTESVIEKVEELLTTTVQDIRSLTFQLRPPVLANVGLAAAIKWLAKEYGEKYGLLVSVSDGVELASFNYDTRSTVFQVIRELLLNVVKHASTRNVDIILHQTSELLEMVVCDYGIGFDTNSIDRLQQEHTGFGLFNVRQKIEYLGGSVSIESTPGHGTRITVSVPNETLSIAEEITP